MFEKVTLRIRSVLDSIGLILMLFSLAFLIPLLVGLWYSESIQSMIKMYIVPMILTANIGLILWVLGIEEEEVLKDRKLLLAICLGWIVLMVLPSSVILPLGKELFPVIAASIIGIVIAVISIVIKYFRKRPRAKEMRDREAFVSVALGWLIISSLGSLPYVFGGILNYTDAFFETMSGFATCGSTVLEVSKGLDYLNIYPHSIMFWRSLTQWLGGIGIVVLSVVVLARGMGPGGARLFKAEVSGHAVVKIKPRIRETASVLWKIYLCITAMGIILLFAAGMPLFDSVCHSFTSLATGGFSTRYSSIGAYNNVLVEIIIIGLMIVGGTNFILHYQFLTGKPKALFTDPEFKFYIFLLSAASVFITLILVLNASCSPLHAFRNAAFQAVSINTATGFSSADFGAWPSSAQVLLLLLMFVGGCVGSTAGGIKVIRSLVLLKVVRRELRRLVHPKSVEPINLGKSPISEELVHNIIAFFFLYLLIFILSTIGIALLEGLDIVSSASAVATTMGTVGPGLGKVGPTTTFALISPVGKIWLSICMWLGRLEIFACLILFLPSTYKS